ncbi:sulfite exporter TauE/SafE family protein [Halocatena marina]|uniref:sulfite exporter TauE/SafE family protein n=1 Tax=Halocatena marina TaxID=2934937 RepID=UPI00221F6127|nr:sulfite exporter TauE/SafE family protein [Halocatena marina]
MIAVSPLHVGGITSAANVELAIFFLIGLLGGAHCLGMCGPLVTMYSERMQSPDRENMLTIFEVRQHALFNLGRTVSYAAIGGAFGLFGALVFDTSSIVSTIGTVVRATTGVVVGIAILIVGVRYVFGYHGGEGLFGGGGISRLFRRLSTRVDEWSSGFGIVGLGLVHGILPCPLLYPAFLYAFARGSPIGGALSLGVLGLGTFPTLFFYGTLVQSISPTHRERLHRALGIAFLIMGWMPLSHGLELFGIHVPHVEPPIYQPLTP